MLPAMRPNPVIRPATLADRPAIIAVLAAEPARVARQARGFKVRLPLDVMLFASANPEDYTNRGRIITPLKDRFGAEITTHYPYDVQHEIGLIAQEADLVAIVPLHLLEVIARFTANCRQSINIVIAHEIGETCEQRCDT